MGKQLDEDALRDLIAQVASYRDNLESDIKVLNEAAVVCDMAMGSDAIAKKYIGKLNDALEELLSVANKAGDVADAMTDDLNRALSVLED